MSEVEPIETTRVILRKLREEDFDAVHEYGSDPEVTRYVPFGPNTPDETRNFINRTICSYSDPEWKERSWAVVLKETDQLIGGCGMRKDRGENASIGYVFNRRFWGNGYATEAARGLLAFGFTEMNLHRMFALCDEENPASAHVMEKIGMRREGHFIQDVRIRDQWRNSYLYAILEGEWQKTCLPEDVKACHPEQIV